MNTTLFSLTTASHALCGEKSTRFLWAAFALVCIGSIIYNCDNGSLHLTPLYPNVGTFNLNRDGSGGTYLMSLHVPLPAIIYWALYTPPREELKYTYIGKTDYLEQETEIISCAPMKK